LNNVQSKSLVVTDALEGPALIVGSFVLNGASPPDPALFGGHVVGVQRLVTSAPAPFFRVTFSERLPGLDSRNTTINVTGRAPVGVSSTYNCAPGGFPANPVNAIATDGTQLDVQVLESGVAVDTAGRVVNLRIVLDKDAIA
jgi:hypothetical protein